MTGRGRVIAALNFQESDKIPLDINAHPSSGIDAVAYMGLREYLELPRSALYIYDFDQRLALVEKDILDFFDADTFQLGLDFAKNHGRWQDFRLEDGTPCKIPVKKDARFPMSANFKRELRETAAASRDGTDRAIYGVFGGSLAETGCKKFGMENFLRGLLIEPGKTQRFLDAVTEKHMENLKTYLDAAGKYIDIIGFNDDMCAQNGPLFSPDIYNDFFFQRQKRMWTYIHDRFPSLKICLHCCGGTRLLMPLFIDAGLDALNPVQRSCKDMALNDLKMELHGKLALWGGGCDTHFMLPGIAPREIRAYVNESVKTMYKGGGFVFQPVHNILKSMPAANIVEMYKTVREFNSGAEGEKNENDSSCKR